MAGVDSIVSTLRQVEAPLGGRNILLRASTLAIPGASADGEADQVGKRKLPAHVGKFDVVRDAHIRVVANGKAWLFREALNDSLLDACDIEMPF